MISQFRLMSIVGLCAIAVSLTGCPTNPTASQSTNPTTTASPTASQPPEGLGLNERRAVEVIEKDSIPSYEEDIKSRCPESSIKIVMDWASFGNNSDAYLKFAETPRSAPYGRGFGSAINALEQVCRDDLGKKAVAEKVKALKVTHVQGLAEGRGKFENGALIVETDVTQDGKQPSIDALKELLEKNL